MQTVLVIEEDPLIRELMREHLEGEGHVTCAVATVRIALEAARWSQFALVLLDAASAASCGAGELSQLRALGAPVVSLRTTPARWAGAPDATSEHVVWSPFDLATLTQAVRTVLPAPDRAPSLSDGPTVVASGTYLAAVHTPADLVCTTLPAPIDDAARVDRVSLAALGDLVLEATGGRRG